MSLYNYFDDEECAAHGGTMHLVPKAPIPYSIYKLLPYFDTKQSWKPQYKSRNPALTVQRYWETAYGHVNEVAGKRWYVGSCVDCGDVVLTVRDVSGPEFRGKGNAGMRGRYPKYCDDCRMRVDEARRDKNAASKRRTERERIAWKRADAVEAKSRAETREAVEQGNLMELNAEDAQWAREDREAEARYRQRTGGRSPYDRQ